MTMLRYSLQELMTMPVGSSKAKSKSVNKVQVNSSNVKRSMESTRARTLDDLALHDELMGGMLGSLKADVTRGMTAEQLLKKYSSLAAARTVQTALTHEDAGLALAASKDIIDRAQGKAKETKEVRHALANSTDEEVDALLLSKLNELDEAADEGEA